MRRYETIVIIDPDLSNEERDPLYEKIRELIPRLKGFLVEFDEWGTQKLAYEIKKKTRGHYFRLDYCGTGELVSEMERSFRIDDRVLKYMTVLLEKDTDVESLKKETGETEEVAEESPAKEPPAKEPPAEESPAKEPPAEEPPAEEPPAEEPPAEEPPAEEEPAEEEPAEAPPEDSESPEPETTDDKTTPQPEDSVEHKEEV